MEIFINNKQHNIKEQSTIKDLLLQLDITQTKGIAIAINNLVIPKEQWEQHTIVEADKVIIITATQGG